MACATPAHERNKHSANIDPHAYRQHVLLNVFVVRWYGLTAYMEYAYRLRGNMSALFVLCCVCARLLLNTIVCLLLMLVLIQFS
jgi:hypothetical protein